LDNISVLQEYYKKDKISYNGEKFNFLITCGEINKDAFLNFIPDFERRGIWIQFVPCSYVLGIEIVEYALKLAVRDYLRGENVAKKLNLQFCLRLFARTQVRDVLELLSRSNRWAVIVIIARNDVEEILEELVERGIITSFVECDKCAGNLGEILSIYDVPLDYVSTLSKMRGERMDSVGIKVVMEKIATVFLWK